MKNQILSKIENLKGQLKTFEIDNAHIFNKHIELKSDLLNAQEEYKKYLLDNNKHLVGLFCNLPNGDIVEIDGVRISNKGGNVICKVKIPVNANTDFLYYDYKEFAIDQLDIKHLPNILI